MKLIERIRQRYDQLVNVSSSDPDDARRRKLLNIILLGMMTVAVILLLPTIILMLSSILKPVDAAALIQALAVTILGVIVFYLINRLWSGKLASFLFLLFLFLVITLADSPAELANGRSVFLFAIPIVAASVLIGPTSTFTFYVFSSVEITILALYAGKPITAGIFPIFSFFFLSLIVWLSSRNLELALKDLRKINAELDLRVADRTRELSESLAREAAQSSLREAILDSIADGVVVFDNNGTAIVANPSLSSLTNVPQNEILGHKLDSLLKNSDLTVEQRSRINDGLAHTGKSQAFRLSWGEKTFSINAAEVQSGVNTSLGTVAVFRDVTHEAELDKLKDTFLAIVSHEMKTPLNAIFGFAEMINEKVYGPVSEGQGKAVLRIMENTNRLLSIVGELLDQAQIQSGRLKINMGPCKPDEMIKSVHDTMSRIAEGKGINLISTLDPSLPPVVMGDTHRLQQIMINLTNNAIKFSESGAEVRLSVSRQDPDFWMIQVTDTGEGIPQESLPYIFDTFRQVESTSTRKHGGVGLGLAIVKQLVDRMNGTITVESKINMGSIFSVSLPLITQLEESK